MVIAERDLGQIFALDHLFVRSGIDTVVRTGLLPFGVRFMDIDVLPNSIEYWGPNLSLIHI